jgi:hypothetical protein
MIRENGAMRLQNASIAALLAALVATPGRAEAPLSAGLLQPKLDPGYHHPNMDGPSESIEAALATGTVQTLPNWTQGFAVKNKSYSYTMVGTDPSAGGVSTIIPTVLIPIRLTVPKYMVNGKPLVLDATGTMPDIIDSPIFTASEFVSGKLQFEDAMLHVEFPKAPAGWHLTFTPTVAPTVDVKATHGVKVYQTKSGKYLAVLSDRSSLDQAINHAVRQASPDTYVVIVTYNALYSNAFGFHGRHLDKKANSITVYTYTSWLEGVNDAFKIPSPNADTLAHEISESTHDPFITSRTKEWGDWFGNNVCFQPFIEVGDAVEDAPRKVQNYHQKIHIGGKTKTYVLQTEALLPWFERQYPCLALNGAYSFPNADALLGPAPFDCVRGK